MSTTQWFRAATQLGKTYPPSKGRLSAGAAFSHALFNHSSIPNCLSAPGTAFKPRVAGQTLRKRCAPGRCLSAIRADRSLPHKPQSSSEDDQRHFITSLREGLYCLSPCYAMSLVIGRLTPHNPHCRTTAKRNVASLPLSAISNGGFVSDGIIALDSLTSGATATAAAYCLARRSPCFGVVPHRALSACKGRTRSRPHPSPTCPRHTLDSRTVSLAAPTSAE